ncbi:GNAT family N-acetyltransferase [Spartinivicinus ruber]|uniref:GNAT family N-acetyltransferase n=1 Tax=Spartinivicinus ruber TaxID=2683272 RepID=UPI0013D7BC54|nr:GNAT family N-acetyltransferase [Spartinivicinus ruber]
MDTSLVTGLAAEQLLTNEQFIHQWQQLYNQSPVAFPYQTPTYVNSWWHSYHHNYDLAFSLGYNNNQLVACLPLCIRGNQITAVGNHQTTYQAWLTVPEKQFDFFSALVTDIQQVFPDGQLTLKYLPTVLLTQTLEKDTGLNEHLTVNNYQGRLFNLDKINISQLQSTNGNKKPINQLEKIDELNFTRIKTAEAQIDLLKQLIPVYDFQQGIKNNKLPFSEDPAKLKFYTTLCLEMTNQLHITGIWLDKKLVSVHLGFINKSTVHLGLFCCAPQYHVYSPEKIHLFKLVELLKEEGYDYLDVTLCENPLIEQHSNEQESLIELIYFSNIKHKQRYEKMQQTSATIRRSGGHMGFTPERYHSLLSLPHKFTSSKALKTVIEQYYCDIELKIYRLKSQPNISDDPNSHFTFNTFNLTDLTEFYSDLTSQDRQQFLTECRKRLANGDIPYSYTDNHKLLANGWLIPNTRQAYFSEVKQGIHLPENSAVLYDICTIPTANSQALHQACIQQQIHDAFTLYGAKQVFTVVRADNTTSRHVIEKNNFEYVGSLHYQHHFNNETKSQQLPDYLTLAS